MSPAGFALTVNPGHYSSSIRIPHHLAALPALFGCLLLPRSSLIIEPPNFQHCCLSVKKLLQAVRSACGEAVSRADLPAVSAVLLKCLLLSFVYHQVSRQFQESTIGLNCAATQSVPHQKDGCLPCAGTSPNAYRQKSIWDLMW